MFRSLWPSPCRLTDRLCPLPGLGCPLVWGTATGQERSGRLTGFGTAPLESAGGTELCHSPLQMDPVQKAVISHTFGVPSPLKKKLFISCNICHLRFNSAVRGSRGNGWEGSGPPLGHCALTSHPLLIPAPSHNPSRPHVAYWDSIFSPLLHTHLLDVPEAIV